MEPEGGKEEKNRGGRDSEWSQVSRVGEGENDRAAGGPKRTSNTSQCQHDITRSGLSGDGCSGRGVQRGRKKERNK